MKVRISEVLLSASLPKAQTLSLQKFVSAFSKARSTRTNVQKVVLIDSKRAIGRKFYLSDEFVRFKKSSNEAKLASLGSLLVVRKLCIDGLLVSPINGQYIF